MPTDLEEDHANADGYDDHHYYSNQLSALRCPYHWYDNFILIHYLLCALCDGYDDDNVDDGVNTGASEAPFFYHSQDRSSHHAGQTFRAAAVMLWSHSRPPSQLHQRYRPGFAVVSEGMITSACRTLTSPDGYDTVAYVTVMLRSL